MRPKGLQQGEEIAIAQNRRRPRMVERVKDLFWWKPYIDRHQRGARHRYCKKTFQITVAVPVHHRHRLAEGYAHTLQYAAETTDASAEFLIGQSAQIAVDDLLVRKLAQGIGEQVLDDEGIVIERHFESPTAIAWSCQQTEPFGALLQLRRSCRR